MKKSRLVLGTAQLGMRYGLNNSTGQPSRKVAFEILDVAYANGINTFDTAFAYGNAEEILGAWIKSRNLAARVHVISKMKPHALNDYPDGTKADRVVLSEISKSLRRLRLKKLDGYLLHTPSYVYLMHVVKGLQIAKEKGLVSSIGVSVYEEAEALQAAELGLDYVQVPYNVLDQRLDHTKFWDIAKKNNVTVFARSPFLQGLLVMDARKIPSHLSHARQSVSKFQRIAREHNLTPAQAALLYTYCHSKAEHVAFGVETLRQLNENISATRGVRGVGWIHMMEQFAKNYGAVVNPSLWSKIKK